MLKNKITSLQILVIWVCRTTLNIFSHWISKPPIRKHKNHSKASSGAGRFSQNLRACKKSQFIVRNCKSGRYNQQHTFRHRKLQHKTTLTNIPYTGLKVKGRKKGKTKISSPRRQIWMICAINLRQDASLCGSTKIKPPFMLFDKPILCNDNILMDSEYSDRFCHCFLNQVDSNTNLLDNVLLTRLLWDQPKTKECRPT